MATREEVASFLSIFVTKSEMFGMIFYGGRQKNMNTLAELEISALEREQEILSLNVTNYKAGPIEDKAGYHNTDMWEFGKKIKGKEVYIKITPGQYNASTLCISFHIAEHKINYPYSDKK